MANAKVGNFERLEDAKRQYTVIRPTYEVFVGKLRCLLQDLLTVQGIRFEAIQGRTKDIDKFVQKLTRPGKSYVNPVSDMPDLAGLRIIHLYLDEVDRTCEVIDADFYVDPTQSVDKRTILSTDQFGYLSVHKIVRLKEPRLSLPEWSQFEGLHAEIQVRTVVQHAWASVSRKIQYTRENEIPPYFRRRLFRLAALFELADEEFVNLGIAQASLRRKIVDDLSAPDMSVPISVDAIELYLQDSKAAKAIAEAALQEGFWGPEPPVERGGAVTLFRVCTLIAIGTIAQLDHALKEVAQRASEFFSSLYSRYPRMMGGDIGFWAASAIAGRAATDTSSLWNDEYSECVLEAGKHAYNASILTDEEAS